MPNPKVLLKHGSESYAIGILCTHEHNGNEVHGNPVLSDEGVFRVEEVLSLAENGDELCHPHYNYEICCGSFVQWKLSETVRHAYLIFSCSFFMSLL